MVESQIRANSTCRHCHASLCNALQLETCQMCVVAASLIHDTMIRLVPSYKFHGVGFLLVYVTFEGTYPLYAQSYKDAYVAGYQTPKSRLYWWDRWFSMARCSAACLQLRSHLG